MSVRPYVRRAQSAHTGADSHISGITIFFLQLDLFLPVSQPLSLQNLVVHILYEIDNML